MFSALVMFSSLYAIFYLGFTYYTDWWAWPTILILLVALNSSAKKVGEDNE